MRECLIPILLDRRVCESGIFVIPLFLYLLYMNEKTIFNSLLFITGLVCFGYFLIQSGFAANPLMIFGIAIFVLMPLRKEHPIARRTLLLTCITFAIWLFRDLGVALLPFGVAFFVSLFN